MGKGDTFWGAYSIDLENELKKIVRKLEEIGIPAPTKIEASKLIAHRQANGLSFMTEEEIKEFIMKNRGFKL